MAAGVRESHDLRGHGGGSVGAYTALPTIRTKPLNTWLHRTSRGIAALALFGLSAMAAAAASPDPVALRRIVDAAVQPVMAQHDVPGMAIAVTVDGHALFFNYGEASRETHQAVTETTLFELGSVSKTFTATLAAYAQALGKLSLDDHPSRSMPALKGTAVDQASLLQLGTYTAGGLPLQVPDAVTDDAGLVRYLQHWKPDAAPGKQRLYSNVSLGLFGRATALALHGDFAALAETQLFPRLGLQHTYVHVPTSALPDYAWGYDPKNRPGRVRPGVFDAETYGIKSTAADMIRFVQLNMDPHMLDAPLQRAIAGTHVGYYKVGDLVQGLGWEQYAYPVSLEQLLQGNSSEVIFEPQAVQPVSAQPAGPRLYDKTGSTRCFGAYVAFVPEKRIGVVMLANRNFPIPARVRAVSAILDGLAAAGR